MTAHWQKSNYSGLPTRLSFGRDIEVYCCWDQIYIK